MNALKRPSLLVQFSRLNCTSAEFVNRNPRNLERIRIARKPDGYHLDRPGKKFWHKLILTPSNRIVTAQVIHYLNGPVIEAKTSEWALRKQLYSVNDTCAYINLGKVFAQRCLEAGIAEMYCDIKPAKGGKVEKFLNEVVNGGIKLEEPEVYRKPHPWELLRPEKPWEVTE
ncbi:hypothetical protein ABMA27_008623 [Loxostege sticticalis]|uniref:Mitochondrial ribosomal protein L17 n=1 Tax=Loxostege sticticalis TaxID=481309 RepID=A0ABR3HC00_LOXSC